ncbi:MAG: cysteine rich repeat-containing protein [Desulfobacteraceae bacterium]|nr:cysteine rich repeat-containing protein [Desulfobacteraceae bacterium]
MKQRSLIVAIALVCLLMLVSIPAQAGDGLLQKVADGCKKELDTYCKDITPGEGRILACLYSRSDKLSAQCEYALYDSAARLERAAAALSYLVHECREDLEKLCGSVAAGEGRLAQCLEKNDAKVSARCKQAQKDVELKK